MADMRGGASAGEDPRRRAYGIAASVALVMAAVVLAFVGGDGGSADDATVSAPEFTSSEGLADLEAGLSHPVYWAGERPPARLELKQEASGSVFLRYLPPGVAVGDEPAGYLTVGTYPVTDAADATRRFARGAGARVLAAPDGAVVVPNPDSAGSVYFAYPDSDLQIEVFDPRPGRALALIRAGAIKPVGED